MSLRPQKIAPKLSSPYERIGGREPVARLVDRFYDLMAGNPAYAELKAIHAEDLSPMREKLTDFLVAWMGGPRDWFDKNPGACIMSAHAAMSGIDRQTAEQWIACMEEAAGEITARDPELSRKMLDSMRSMSLTMAKRAAEAADPQG